MGKTQNNKHEHRYSPRLLCQQTSHEPRAVSHHLQPHEEFLNSSAQSTQVQLPEGGRLQQAQRSQLLKLPS